MKRDKYTKTLAKNQVCEIFQMRDIGKNGLPKLIKLCMETPRGTQREYSSKPLKHSIVKRILVFKR